jgi:hypothetical protein
MVANVEIASEVCHAERADQRVDSKNVLTDNGVHATQGYEQWVQQEPGVTVVSDEAQLKESFGEAIAKQITGKIGFAKEIWST